MDLDITEILLVEDNPSDAELALRAFKEANLVNKVLWVKEGAEALDFLFATGKYADRNINIKPKVILLDLKLPKIDGIEVLRRVKTDARTKIIPVVVLTSSREEKDFMETYKLSVNSYVVKPVDFNEFTKAIKDIGNYWVFLNKYP